MVGHSLGGVLVRVNDQQFPGEVVGFVLVDSSHPEQDSRLPAEIQDAMPDEPGSPFLFRLLAPYRIFVGERQTPGTAYWWRSFPEGVLTEAAAAESIFAQSARTGSLGDRPLVLLTAGEVPDMPGISPGGNTAFRQVLLELKLELAELSSNSDQRVVDGAGHYIRRDRPEAVVTAIQDGVSAAREPGREVPRVDSNRE